MATWRVGDLDDEVERSDGVGQHRFTTSTSKSMERDLACFCDKPGERQKEVGVGGTRFSHPSR